MATAKPKYWVPKLASAPGGVRTYNVSSSWKEVRGSKLKFQGITVFAPVDPYKARERKEFRTAMDNPYVYRAVRIQTTFTTGHGYTTSVVPRKEKDLPAEQVEAFAQQTFNVPYWDNKPFSAEQIKDWIDKLSDDLDLQTNVFNGYYTAIEQGRGVLVMTPIDKDEDGKWCLPEQIRYIRPEFTMRPLLADMTGELKGVQCVGVMSEQFNDIVPAERAIYITQGFNNELFADFYGDSKVARISDIANTLNIIFNQDYPNAAKHSWFKSRTWAVPIPPQEYGNEQGVLDTFMNKVTDAEGRDVAVTGPSNPEEIGVTLLADGGGGKADIGSLEIIRNGLIKAILSAFGIPGFMLAEGDYGSLGGNANLAEIDSYINTEILHEKRSLENTLESQYYDRILCILFDCEDPDKLPIRIVHKFNKPKLWTLLSAEMFGVLERMVQDGLIDEVGIRDVLGLEELDKETMSTGTDASPATSHSGWANGSGWNNNGTSWPSPQLNWPTSTTSGTGWGNSPRDKWLTSVPKTKSKLDAWYKKGIKNGWVR